MLLSFKFGGGKDFDEIVIMYCPAGAVLEVTSHFLITNIIPHPGH
jgi:hypothetical protein